MKNSGTSTIITENPQQVGSFWFEKVGMEGASEAWNPSLLDTTQANVSSILLDVSWVLTTERITWAKDQAREFQERMKLFVHEAEKVRDVFGYGYDWEDYKMRLSVSDSVVKKVFERMLSENEELRKAYEGVMGEFSGDKEKLKERIIKEYVGDLAYEAMKEGEYSKMGMGGKLDCTGKSAKEVKEMVVEFARFGGKRLNLGNSWLEIIFAGEAKLFKKIVVEFAKNWGKWLDLRRNSLEIIFAGEPQLFNEMVAEFAKSGGKWLELWSNLLYKIYAGEPQLFKEMVVEFARFGGKGLEFQWIWLRKLFAEKPGLFKEMVVEFAKSGGKWLDLRNPLLDHILDSPIRDVWSITRKLLTFFKKEVTVREIIEETCKTYWVTIELK
jgi:hypothetical protein